MPAQFHGKPMSEQGSLVTVDWGFDLLDYLAWHYGLSVAMHTIDDLTRGVRALADRGDRLAQGSAARAVAGGAGFRPPCGRRRGG